MTTITYSVDEMVWEISQDGKEFEVENLAELLAEARKLPSLKKLDILIDSA